MIKERAKMRVAFDNEHLLDIFTDYHYLELGNIHYTMWTRLLKYNTIIINDMIDFNIQNKGVGASNVSNKIIQNYLPYLNLFNIYKKNQTMQLFLTYGIIKIKNEMKKEIFAPAILVPVNLYLENNTILIKVISKPLENIVLLNYLKKYKIEITYDKLETIYHFDKYCSHFQKLDFEFRFESYLTFAKTLEPPILINHEYYSLENKFLEPLGNRYYRDDESEIFNITLLNNRQRMAVQKASSGNSFAITGVLGTGKTTTLINIASNAIKRNKHILYVSNMKETLDYVEEVFDDRGLKFLVNNLTNTSKYIITKNKNDINDYSIENPKETKKELKKVYQDIDNYEKFLSGRIRNFRFLDVLKELLNLECIESDEEMDNLDHIYKFEYEEIINSLYRVEEAMKKICFKDSKFTNIPINNNIKYPNQVITLIFQIHKFFTELKESKEILEKEYKFKEIPNYAKFKNIIANVKNLKVDKLPNIWKQDNLNKYYEARNMFAELKTLIYSLQEYQLYLDWDFINIDTIDIDAAINNLLGEYFTEKNVEEVNKIIENHHELINKVKTANQHFKLMLKNIENIKSILDWNFNNSDEKAIKEVIRLIDFLNSGIYHRKWLIKSQHEKMRADLVKIQIKLNHFIYLEKQYSKYFNNPNEVDNNISFIENAIATGKVNKKFKNVDLELLLQDIKEYKRLRNTTNKYNKLHISLTGFEYSPAFNSVAAFDKFVNYLKGFNTFEYETIITKFLLRVNENDLDSYSLEFQNFRRSYQIVNYCYNQVIDLVDEKSEVSLIQKGEFLNKIYKYLVQVRNTNLEMQSIVKSGSKYIYFETYLKLRDRLTYVCNTKKILNENSLFVELFDNLFNYEKTNINDISNLIKSYDLYIDCFTNAQATVSSLIDDKFEEINFLLDQASDYIHEINDSFKLYSKIFKDGIGGYYYDDFQIVINHLDELLHAKDELINYLEITNNLKIIKKYNLHILSNYIIKKNATNIVSNFKYLYFQNLYKLYVQNNTNLYENIDVRKLLEKAITNEKILMESHIISLQALKGNRQDNKVLFLATTPILNYFLDYRDFDLILIDDAHLLEANEYYNAVNGNQVIIAGEDISAFTSSLISRMRDNYTMNLNFRYSVTPLHLLSLIPNVKGTFRSRVSENNGVEVIYRDVSKYIANLLINNANLLINYFTPKLETKIMLTEEITQILINNNFDAKMIFTILRKRLNIIDLFDNYVYDADYNILDLQDYYQNDYEQLTLNNITALLTCKKQLVIVDTDNIIRKDINNQFMNALSPILKQKLKFNLDIQDVLLKLASELNKFGIIVHGSLFDLNLVLERNNTFYGVLLFTNPDNAHMDIIEDYREYYEVCRKNNMKVLIIWILDLVRDFNSVVEYLHQETLS